MEKWIDNYLDRGQNTIIKSLEKDKYSNEQCKQLLEYEKANDNRMKVIDTLKKYISIGKKDNTKKEIKKPIKKENKEEINMTEKENKNNAFVIWTGKQNGMTLPEKAGGATVLRRRPTEVTADALKYMKDTYDEDSFKELSESEFKNFGKKKETKK